MSALHKDRVLLRKFLVDLVRVKPLRATSELAVLEQKYPGEPERGEEELERRGIPDAWICDEKHEWCVLIESKVLDKPTVGQITRHVRIAERLGFKHIFPVVITARSPGFTTGYAKVLEWRQVYAWLLSHSREHLWAAECATYLEIIEAKMTEAGQYVEGTLTMFSGFHFGKDHPFSYLEAKRVLVMAMHELRTRQELAKRLGAELTLAGRPAITRSEGDAVWDFIRLSEQPNFTTGPHLTLGLLQDHVDVMLTIPNSVSTFARKSVSGLALTGFREVVGQVLKNMEPLIAASKGITPIFRGIQRRYSSQRAKPEVDAIIEFDLRTAFGVGGPPKLQPVWLEAAYGAFVDKKGNYQIQIGAIFRYEKCPALRTPTAIDLVERTWLACKPLIDLTRQA